MRLLAIRLNIAVLLMFVVSGVFIFLGLDSFPDVVCVAGFFLLLACPIINLKVLLRNQKDSGT